MTILPCRSAQASQPGRRPTNQDAVIAAALPGGREVLAVADGVGGHAAGAVASALALDTLVERLRAGAGLASAVDAANEAVHGAGNRTAAYRGMGTTLVALLQAGGEYRIANVGDSRAYRLRHDGIEQLTLDHSFLAEAERVGGMSSVEAAQSPWRNALTRALGTEPKVEVDVFGPFEVGIEPHVVVLCSDGVYKAVTDDAMWRCLLAAADAQAAATSLTELAFRNGSDDNLTVALMELGLVFAGTEATATTPIPIRQSPSGRAPSVPTREARAGAARAPAAGSARAPVGSVRAPAGGSVAATTQAAAPAGHSDLAANALPAMDTPARRWWLRWKPTRTRWGDVVFLFLAGALLLGLGLYLAAL